jgi:tRNA(adenine34) deaminase
MMCAGAILQARISRVVFGAFNTEISSISTIELLREGNSQLEVFGGVRDEKCSLVLSKWFSKQRIEKG